MRVSIITLPTRKIFSFATPSRARFSSPSLDGVKSMSASWSVTRRLISSGMERSNERDVGFVGDHDGLEAAHDGRGLLRMRPRAYVQTLVGIRNAQALEEDIGHERVVVLAGVDEDLPVPMVRQRTIDRGRFHEVWPRSDYV